MGIRIKLSALLFSAFYFCSTAILYADIADTKIRGFVDQALQLKLHERASWRDLLHYRPNLITPGYTSQADSSNFFFANDGKFNPKAELRATLRALFKPLFISKPNDHPQCLFIARKNWLAKQLPALKTALPSVDCPEYKEWINSINPNSVTLAFPAAYINNPGSMFGHTLLRVDPPAAQKQNYLTSYAITYAANTNETNGLAFAIKGLAGGYPGLFAIVPYYDKVNEYNDLENRDIWEYELDLTPTEANRMLQHMWELRKTIFDYYFLDENCSYQLLALLDVARPGLNLAAEFPLDVIPADTVRVIVSKKLVKKTRYRPSLLTNLKFQLEEYAGSNLPLILDYVHGKEKTSSSQFTALDETNKIYVLETAYNYLQYLYKSNELNRADYAKRSLTILKVRNKLNPSINIPLAKQPLIRPEQGHKSSRIQLSYGKKINDEFVEFNWRPAYHDLLDNNDGYVDGLQINFIDVFARLNTKQNKVYLEKIDFFSIYSIKQRTTFFKPISWKFKTSYERLPVVTDANTLVLNFNGAAGLSYEFFNSIRVYALLESTILFHARFKNTASAALGPNLGFIWEVTPSWKIWLDATNQYYDSNNNNLTYQQLKLAQSYSISKNQSIRLQLLQQGIKHKLQNEFKVSLNWYY